MQPLAMGRKRLDRYGLLRARVRSKKKVAATFFWATFL
jgi:hypothetical protein